MRKQQVVFVVYTFVSYTDLIEMAKFSSNEIEDVVENMKRALDSWGGMIRATGGALVAEKTFCYTIDFNWDNSK